MWRHYAEVTALLLISIGRPAAVFADSSDSLAGLSLEEGLNRYERDGLRLFYSSDLVRGAMRIETEPTDTDPVTAVAQLLAPHRLMLRPGLNDTWLIVRIPAAETRSDPASSDNLLDSAIAQPTIAPALEELIVSASQYEITRSQTTLPQVIGRRDLEQMPDIGDDVIRAVARLPGIASNGFSALSHFRGGESGETLVRFDGLRLYDPFHLRDFQSVFSVIDPRIVSSMNIYTGGFPATFGDRMSGVVDIESMSVDEDIYHEVGASFFNTSILSSGKFANERAEWLASLRRSNLDILYDRFSDQPDRPRYSDLFAKLHIDVSDALGLTANILRAEDEVSLADDEDREEQAQARQRDSYDWLKLDYATNSRTSGSAQFARTRIDSSRSGTSEKTGVSAGTLNDVQSFTLTTLQSDWSRLIGARMLLDFGASLTRMRGHYKYDDEVDFDVLFNADGAATVPQRTRSIAVQPTGRQQSMYANLKVDWNSRIATDFGIRWNRQSISGVRNSTLGPRIGIRYRLAQKSTLRASWGKFFQTQAINELQVSDGIVQFDRPQQSEQFVIGFDRELESGFAFRAEAYAKEMRDLRPRFENILNARVLLPELKPDRIRLEPDSATAYGIELAFDGTAGRFDFWGGLSWARVKDKFADTTTLRSWDQTYSLSTGFNTSLGDWTLSAAVTYRTGWPTSTVMPLEGAAFPTVTVPVRNEIRLNAYGSLDVRLSRDFLLRRSSLSIFAEIANITGRDNPCCLEFEVGDEEDAGQFILDELAYLSTIPSIGFLWKF